MMPIDRLVTALISAALIFFQAHISGATEEAPLTLEPFGMNVELQDHIGYAYFDTYVDPLSVIEQGGVFRPFSQYKNEGDPAKDQFWLHLKIDTSMTQDQSYWLLSRRFPYDSAYFVYANGSEIIQSDRIIKKQVSINRVGFFLQAAPTNAEDLYILFENVLIADRIAELIIQSNDVHQSTIYREAIVATAFFLTIIGTLLFTIYLYCILPINTLVALGVMLILLSGHTVLYTGTTWGLFSIDASLPYWRLNSFILGIILALMCYIFGQMMKESEAGILFTVLNDMLVLLAVLSAIPVIIVPGSQLMLSISILNGVAAFVSAAIISLAIVFALKRYTAAKVFVLAYMPLYLGASYRILVIQSGAAQEPYIFPYVTIIGSIIFAVVLNYEYFRHARGDIKL